MITADDAQLGLNIGAASRVARVTHDDIHVAIASGALPHHRDHEGRRAVTLGDLLAWMRNRRR